MATAAESRYSVRTQQLCLWSVPVTGAILLIAFVMFPGFFPPMSPNDSATQVADFYRDNTSRIQFSMVVFNLFNVMLVPFYAVVITQIRRMATPSQALGYCYLTAVVSGATLFALADIFWLVAAFRPDRNPELVQLLNDIAWIVLVAPVGMMVVQGLVLALAIYLDDQANPVLPRWVGPFNLIAAALWAPAAAAAVTRSGPFAWDGFISFWLHWAVLAVYVIVMLGVLNTAVRKQVAAAPLDDDRLSDPEYAV